MNKCKYCGEEIMEDEAHLLIIEEPTLTFGRFVNRELKLLHKRDMVHENCYMRLKK